MNDHENGDAPDDDLPEASNNMTQRLCSTFDSRSPGVGTMAQTLERRVHEPQCDKPATRMTTM